MTEEEISSVYLFRGPEPWCDPDMYEYEDAIRYMMLAFGDPQPTKHSARVIHDIVSRDMKCLLWEADAYAEFRLSSEVSLVDLLKENRFMEADLCTKLLDSVKFSHGDILQFLKDEVMDFYVYKKLLEANKISYEDIHIATWEREKKEIHHCRNVCANLVKKKKVSLEDLWHVIKENKLLYASMCVEIINKKNISREHLLKILTENKLIDNNMHAAFVVTKTISHEDLLFLMRKNKIKIKRLLNYLSVDATKHSVDGLKFSYRPKSSNLEKCLEFLDCIQDLNELTSIFEDCIIDEGVKRRMQVRESIISNMDSKRYVAFSEKLREAAFCPKLKMEPKFKKWILKDSSISKSITPLAWTIISFLARETVAELVDMVLLMRERRKFKIQPNVESISEPLSPKSIPCDSAEQDPDKIASDSSQVVTKSYECDSDTQKLEEDTFLQLEDMIAKMDEECDAWLNQRKETKATTKVVPDSITSPEVVPVSITSPEVVPVSITSSEVVQAYFRFQPSVKPVLDFGDYDQHPSPPLCLLSASEYVNYFPY